MVLIGAELFSISTGSDAVNKSYTSAEGLSPPRDLCKHKNELHHCWIHLCIFSPPSSLAVLIEGHCNQKLFCLFSALSSPLPDHCLSYTEHKKPFLFRWHKWNYTTCNRPPTVQGRGLYFTSSRGGWTYRDISFKAVISHCLLFSLDKQYSILMRSKLLSLPLPPCQGEKAGFPETSSMWPYIYNICNLLNHWK